MIGTERSQHVSINWNSRGPIFLFQESVGLQTTDPPQAILGDFLMLNPLGPTCGSFKDESTGNGEEILVMFMVIWIDWMDLPRAHWNDERIRGKIRGN